MGMTGTVIDFFEDMEINLRNREELEKEYNSILEDNREENI